MKISNNALEATEVTETEIKVIALGKSKKKISVESISEAIEEIKELQFYNTKIELDGEIVYFSERNGSIERWEKEWKRQKRKISLEENAWDCPHGVNACYKNDLCIECKMEKASG